MQISFNTPFDIESIINIYAMDSSSFLVYHYFRKCENSTIENSISQVSDNLAVT